MGSADGEKDVMAMKTTAVEKGRALGVRCGTRSY